MRKLAFVFTTVLALCLFTVFAVAQTPGGTTGTNSSNNPSNSPNSVSNDAQQSSAPVTGSQTDPYSVNSGSNGRAANSAASDSNSAGEKTLEGCIVKEQTDYFIQPRDGDRERLTGSQDLSSHVGHQVKVHGTEQSNTTANSTGNVGVSGTAGTSGSMASNSDRTATSGSAKSETQNNAAGSIAGNAGSSNATGTASSSSANNNWTGKDFMVTKVDMMSDSCPADIQKKIDENKMK
jgi:hypothetical protein